MQVQIFSKPDCIYCTKAKALLDQLSMPYIEQIVGKDITSESYKDLYWPTTPCILIDGVKIGGYDELAQWAIDNNKFG